MKLSLDQEVKQALAVTLDGVEYNVQFTPVETVKAEQVIGRSLKWVGDWLRLSTEEVPKVLACGIQDSQDDVIALTEKIAPTLTPEVLFELHEALCWLTWPRKMQEFREKAAEKVSPNAPSADAR